MTVSTDVDLSPDDHVDAQVCLIGAGASGLAAGKALSERGITFDWFEKGSMVGGLWQIDNDNGAVAAYKTLHLNSSRERTQFPSFPMPAHWPDYPNHSLIAEYVEDYARENDLLRRITFNAEVVRVEPSPGEGHPGTNGWAVTTTATGTRTYRNVIVANGHHSRPKVPESTVYDPAHNRMPLYERVLTPERPGLFFVGFIQTVGANIRLYEYQSEWIGDLLTGEAAWPSESEMRRWIASDQEAKAKRYIHSERHTVQVDYWRCIRAMREARARKTHRSLADRVTAPLAGLR